MSCVRLSSLIFCNITILKEASKMDLKTYPVIDPVATGNNIRRLRMETMSRTRIVTTYGSILNSSSVLLDRPGI